MAELTPEQNSIWHRGYRIGLVVGVISCMTGVLLSHLYQWVSGATLTSKVIEWLS